MSFNEITGANAGERLEFAWNSRVVLPAHDFSAPFRAASWFGCSTCGCHFHARFDAQVFGDALDDQAKIARGGVAVAMEHPVQRLFAQAGLPRQSLERDFGVDKIAKYGKTLSRFALQQRAHGFGTKRPRKFPVAFDARLNSFVVISR